MFNILYFTSGSHSAGRLCLGSSALPQPDSVANESYSGDLICASGILLDLNSLKWGLVRYLDSMWLSWRHSAAGEIFQMAAVGLEPVTAGITRPCNDRLPTASPKYTSYVNVCWCICACPRSPQPSIHCCLIDALCWRPPRYSRMYYW